MDYQKLKYGIFAEAPDLLETLPALGKLKEVCPSYIESAENAQKKGRWFAREIMLPRVLDTDTKCSKDPAYFDRELWKIGNREKLNIAVIPEKLGGLGWSALDAAVALEEMTSVCLASTANIMFNTFGLLCAVVECRTGLVLRVIKQMVDAQRQGEPLSFSWAITEPGAGTDAEDGRAMATMKPSTRADKVKGGYILNGIKCFITNGSIAHYVIATIPVDPSNPRESMATFFVPVDTDGFSVGRIERKCGQKASQTAELFFNNVFVPDENVWAPPGKGLAHTREILSLTRGFVGLAGLGLARGAFERCVQFASWKKIKNHRLIDEDWVQFALSDMLKDIMAVRSAGIDFAVSLDTYHVYSIFKKAPVKAALKFLPEKVLLSDRLISLAQSEAFSRAGSAYKKKLVTEDLVETFVKNGSAVKVAGTDLAMKVSSRVLDIVGLEGMSYRFGIEKYFRDAKLTQIYEGSNQANRIDLFHNSIGRII